MTAEAILLENRKKLAPLLGKNSLYSTASLRGIRLESCSFISRSAFMARDSREQEVISNSFGTITDKRIIFSSNKGLFNSGSQEELLLKQVASVRCYQQKSIVAILAGTIGIVLPLVVVTLLRGNLIVLMIGAIIIGLCVWITYLGITGFPTVTVTTAEGKSTQATGWPNDKSEAKAFALVLREKINS